MTDYTNHQKESIQIYRYRALAQPFEAWQRPMEWITFNFSTSDTLKHVKETPLQTGWRLAKEKFPRCEFYSEQVSLLSSKSEGNKMEKTIKFEPAFDKRSSNPDKSYGIHGVSLSFTLKGKFGAIRFVLFTNWHLSHVEKELDNKMDKECPHLYCYPQPADVEYHSLKPMYDGQKIAVDKCNCLGGKPCYYDISYSKADKIYEVLVEKGDEAVWKKLEEYYVDTFKKLE